MQLIPDGTLPAGTVPPGVSLYANYNNETALYVDKSGTPLLLPPYGQPVPAADFTASTDVKSDINKLNAGITGGIGVAKSLGPGSLILDARGAYGLRDIQTDPKNGKNNTGSFVVALGYELRI